MRLLCVISLAVWGVATSMAATPDQRGFIRDWLLLGPYPSYRIGNTADGLDTDRLCAFGGETTCSPLSDKNDTAVFNADLSKLIAGIGSTNEWGLKETCEVPVAWEAFHVTADSPNVVLDKRHSVFDDHIVTYALCFIESPEAREIKLRIGSDDDFKVFLNGALIGRHAGSQGIVPDQFVFNAKLKRGLNTLLFKCVDRILGYGFCLALSDRDNRPLSDLNIRLDDPRLAARQRHGLKRTPGAFDRGVWAEFTTPELSGDGTASIRFGSETVPAGDAHLTLLRDSKTVAEKNQRLSLDGGTGEVNLEHPFLPGIYELVFRYADAEFRESFEIHSPEKLAARRSEIEHQITAQKRATEALRAANAALVQNNLALKEKYRRSFGELETFYLANRQLALRGVASQPKTPFQTEPTAERVTVNLNGDRWRISQDGEHWRQVRLPRTHFNRYYRRHQFPLELVDPKNSWGDVVNRPGFDDWRYDDSYNWETFRAQIDVELPAGAGAYYFHCDQINGKVTLAMNGTPCGEWGGSLGLVRIPLKNVLPGINRLELEFTAPKQAFGFYNKRLSDFFGIRGTLSIEAVPSPVLTRDVTIKSSWRKGTLAVAGTVENNTAEVVAVTVKRYAMLNGEVCFRLPELAGTVPANGTLELGNSALWPDPELWGIGGKYGEPVLYTLVSDLYADGQLRDRHTENFGFREFWIAGSAFFLNGRHILLQGDNGLAGIDTPKSSEITFDLLRRDNINIIRSHDGEFASPDFLRTADRMGMLAYPNMYPILYLNSTQESLTDFISYDDWLKHPLHRLNERNYREWFRMLRNHPSVAVLSTDNEIWTQSWDTVAREALNIRNDRLATYYEKFVKSLDPDRVMTRNGDVGTWGFHEKYREEPPCDTANYHYPDFNIDNVVRNWQSVFGFRPVIYGETLYYSYGAWDKWIGAIPSQVARKAARVREVASLYRELLVPGQIYMGLAHDGFLRFDDTGTGNPWGIKSSDHDAGKVPGFPGYPFARLQWPASSGPAAQREFIGYEVKYAPMFNWFDSRYPSHIRNEVNDAYRDSLEPMPPVAAPGNAECIVELGREGAGKTVTARAQANADHSIAVVADSAGHAWFELPHPGVYEFRTGDESKRVKLAGRDSYWQKPGFDHITRIQWKE